jgi:hypothetical protein
MFWKNAYVTTVSLSESVLQLSVLGCAMREMSCCYGTLSAYTLRNLLKSVIFLSRWSAFRPRLQHITSGREAEVRCQVPWIGFCYRPTQYNKKKLACRLSGSQTPPKGIPKFSQSDISRMESITKYAFNFFFLVTVTTIKVTNLRAYEN